MQTKDTEPLAILESTRHTKDRVVLKKVTDGTTIKCYTCKNLKGRRFLVTSQCSIWKRMLIFRRKKIFQLKFNGTTMHCQKNDDSLSYELILNDNILLSVDNRLAYRFTYLITNEIIQNFHPRAGYTVLSKYGEGGFGDIFKVYCGNVQSIRALKKIKTRKIENQRDVRALQKSLEDEFLILKDLEHENIIKVYFFYMNIWSFELEFCHGESLYHHLRIGTKSTECKMKNVFIQIFDALSYLHDSSITHRDVKTENLLFLDEDLTVVKLIDFGLSARKTCDLVKDCGTAYYIAPEIAIKYLEYNSDTYNCSVDTWGAAVCLFEMMTGGYLPFGDNKKYGKIYRPSNIMNYLKEVVDEPCRPHLNLLGVMYWHPLYMLLEVIFQKESDSRPSCFKILKHEWFNNASYDIFN